MRFLNLYHKKRFKPEPKSLRIDGVSTRMTAKADDAELAAQALLEHMSEKGNKKKETKEKQAKEGTPEFYQQMRDKIKEAHTADARDALRYLAYIEEELKENPNQEQLVEIERGLYQHRDAAEREGGDLKARWQDCLAQVIVLQTKDIPDAVEDIT